MAQIERPLSAPAPLTANHDLAEFDCGEPALDDWLRQRALKNESRFSRTYVVAEGKRVVGFVSLSAGSVERAQAPGKMRRNAPDPIPVAIVARLAVDRNYGGRGLGADLLADGLRRIAGAAGSIGVAAVLVHAKSEAAKRFCLRCAEFMEYPQDSRILFLPIETLIEALVEQGG
jgi:ribosomal protein S18 acetylase RimI-like enzyme